MQRIRALATAIARRHVLAGVLLAAVLGAAPSAGWAQKAAPITIVINQSPWFDGFRNIVERYEEETGNKVELDVNPFAGSLEKQRNSVRAAQGQYDILIMNSGWYAEMYAGGFLAPITDIDPGFKLDPQIYTYDDTIYYDPATKTQKKETGKLMSMPVNPNIPLLFYRKDLYDQQGLKVPETWDELLANATKLHNPPRMYGIVQRGARGPHSVAYDFYPYLYGFGGSIYQDQANNDFTVTLNSEKGKEALDYYVKLAREVGHPSTAGLDQGAVIQNIVTGKAAHAILVIAAWPQMEDPQKSAVVGKMATALPPHAPGVKPAPGLGHWLAGIAANVPEGAAAGGGRVLQVVPDTGGPDRLHRGRRHPGSEAAYEAPIAKEPQYRWMEAMRAGARRWRSTSTPSRRPPR